MKRARFVARYLFYEAVMGVATYSDGPAWLWALQCQERLQQAEDQAGRDWHAPRWL